jgi:ABC-type multidrug transport system fused ATPase/permease subunit
MADEEQKKPKKSDDEVAGKVYDSRLIRRLGHYLRPYWIQAAVSTAAISLKSLCDVAGPYLVMVGIDRYFAPGANATHPAGFVVQMLKKANWLGRLLPDDPYQGITRLAAIYLCALVSAYAFQFIQTYLMHLTCAATSSATCSGCTSASLTPTRSAASSPASPPT